MFYTNDIALDILNGALSVCDLLDDITFLKDIDDSIVELAKKSNNWPSTTIAKKRKEILAKIEMLSN